MDLRNPLKANCIILAYIYHTQNIPAISAQKIPGQECLGIYYQIILYPVIYSGSMSRTSTSNTSISLGPIPAAGWPLAP